MGKIIFLPALNMQLRNGFVANREWKSKDITFFSKNAIDYYPHLLVSSWWEKDWHSSKTDNLSYKELLTLPNDLTLYADSGGFQAGRTGIELDVEGLSKWQISNCDLFVGFDLPPDMIENGSVNTPTSEQQFQEKLSKTYNNNKWLVDNYPSEIVDKYYNVMHGTTLERRDIFFDKLSKLPFKRIAVAARPSGNPIVQAFALCHIISKGVNGIVHLLGIGGFNVLPILPYLKEHFEQLTVDSSSYGQGAITRCYTYGKQSKVYLGNKVDNAGVSFREKIQIDGLPCQCKVCSSINPDEVSILWEPGTVGGSLIAMHNLRYTIDYLQGFDSAFDSLGKQGYKDYVVSVTNNTNNNKIIIALSLIDDYFRYNSIEKVYRKYCKLMGIEDKIYLQHNSLFEGDNNE